LDKVKKPARVNEASASGTRRGASAAAPKSGRRKASSAPPAGRVIFLIGFTGAGKSTVGRLLAIRMGNPFIDLEQEISLRAGMATPMIVSRYGEEGYRSFETAVLGKVLEPAENISAIVATGDGIVDVPRNVDTMRHHGLVCFLHATFEEVLRRLSSEVPVRPLVQDRDTLLRNFDLRSKLYDAAAHLTLATDQRDPSQIVLELAQKLDEHDKARSRSRGSKRTRSG